MRKNYLFWIILIFMSVALLGCDEDNIPLEVPPEEEEDPIRQGLVAYTDTTDYTIDHVTTHISFHVENHTDSTAVFSHCGEQMTYQLQRFEGNEPITLGGWGYPCHAIYGSGDFPIGADSSYFAYKRQDSPGVYRFLLRYHWNDSEVVDTLYTNQFTVHDNRKYVWELVQEFTHKQTQHTFIFTPRTDQIGVKFYAGVTPEEIADLASQHHLTELSTNTIESGYGVFQIDDSFSLTEIGSQVIEAPIVRDAGPIYEDQSGAIRYVDPEWYIIQMADSLSVAEIEDWFISYAGEIIESRDTHGLYVLRCFTHHPGYNVFDRIRYLIRWSVVVYTEPLYYTPEFE